MPMRVAVLGGNGKTGRAVREALARRGHDTLSIGREQWPRLADAVAGADAAYLIAPNMHRDEPSYVGEALESLRSAGVPRVVYHSVASPYAPQMPHHVGKARAEDLVRRSGLAWTILQPGPYLQNLALGADLEVPYDIHALFGFVDLADVAAAAAVVLSEDGHVGATYELATRLATTAELAAEAGHRATRVPSTADDPWLQAMFDYYDRHGLPVGTRALRMLLGRE